MRDGDRVIVHKRAPFRRERRRTSPDPAAFNLRVFHRVPAAAVQVLPELALGRRAEALRGR